MITNTGLTKGLTKEERDKELKLFCLELANKQSIMDKKMNRMRDKTSQEIISDAEKFYSFLKRKNEV